jgi:hypothetical protein
LVTAGLLVSPLATTAVGALECQPEAPVGRTGHWSWRSIDGKRCWYPGRPGMAKTNLRWAQSSPPTLARGNDEGPRPSPAAARRDPRIEASAPGDNDEALLGSYWPALEPASFDERWPK